MLDVKSHLYKNKIIIISYRCNKKGQYLEKLKVIKIIY